MRSFAEKEEEYYREKDEEQEYLQNLSNEGEALNQIQIERSKDKCTKCGVKICNTCPIDDDARTCELCDATLCKPCWGKQI